MWMFHSLVHLFDLSITSFNERLLAAVSIKFYRASSDREVSRPATGIVLHEDGHYIGHSVLWSRSICEEAVQSAPVSFPTAFQVKHDSSINWFTEIYRKFQDEDEAILPVVDRSGIHFSLLDLLFLPNGWFYQLPEFETFDVAVLHDLGFTRNIACDAGSLRYDTVLL